MEENTQAAADTGAAVTQEPEKTAAIGELKTAQTLLGSNVQPASFSFTDADGTVVDMTLGQIVAQAQFESGMSADDWNAQTDAEREAKIADEVIFRKDVIERTSLKTPAAAAMAQASPDTPPADLAGAAPVISGVLNGEPVGNTKPEDMPAATTLPIAETTGNAGTAVAAVEVEPPAPPPVMPFWKSHKVVRAAKITEVRNDWARRAVMVEGLPGLVDVGEMWLLKHEPEVGGYLVEYEPVGDEAPYRSYSPAGVFEAGYLPLV